MWEVMVGEKGRWEKGFQKGWFNGSIGVLGIGIGCVVGGVTCLWWGQISWG